MANHSRVLMRNALVDALTSGDFKQAKGVRKTRSGAYSISGLIGKVAAMVGVGAKGSRVTDGTKALSFGGSNGLVLTFASGLSVDLAALNDAGVSFETLGTLIEDWRNDKRKASAASGS